MIHTAPVSTIQELSLNLESSHEKTHFLTTTQNHLKMWICDQMAAWQ